MEAERPNRLLLTAFAGAALFVLTAVALSVHAANRDHENRTRLREQADRQRRAALERPTTLDALRGHWVWTREVDRGVVRRAITPGDMIAAAGPLGWPGCPENILCTHYGVHGIVIGDGDRVHIVHHVVTSSDFQFEGSIRMQEPGLLVFGLDHLFSCAHPGIRGDSHETRYARVMRRDDDLWLSVARFTEGDVAFGLEVPEPQPERWVVYRHVTREVFYRRYLLRRCQPTAEAPSCDPECFSDRLGE